MAAPAPVLAPNKPIESADVRASARAQSIASTTRAPRSEISKTLRRSFASASVSRSNSSVAKTQMIEMVGSLAIACAETARPTAMGEDHETDRRFRQHQQTRQRATPDYDFRWLRHCATLTHYFSLRRNRASFHDQDQTKRDDDGLRRFLDKDNARRIAIA